MNIEDLADNLQQLQDLEEIKKLQREYMQHIDNLEFRKVLDLFTDDATVEIRNSGVLKSKKEIESIYLNRLGKRKVRNDGHLVGEPVISVKGDKAEGHWTVYIFFSVPSVRWVQGRNDMEYAKVNGQWKISKLKFIRTLSSDPCDMTFEAEMAKKVKN
jgi:hypothetical protein